MKKQHKILALLAGLALLIVAIPVALGFSFGKSGEVVRPSCDWMSTPEQVDQALAQYKNLTREIEALGEGISVTKTLACDDEKALITISYTDKGDFQKISDALKDPRYDASIEVIRR